MEYGFVPGNEKPVSRLVQGAVCFSDANLGDSTWLELQTKEEPS